MLLKRKKYNPKTKVDLNSKIEIINIHNTVVQLMQATMYMPPYKSILYSTSNRPVKKMRTSEILHIIIPKKKKLPHIKKYILRLGSILENKNPLWTKSSLSLRILISHIY